MKKIKLPIMQEITTDIIDYVINKHTNEAERIDKLKAIYDNKCDINNRQMDADKPNNKLSHPYAAFITEMAVGHAFGVPISYKTDDEQLSERIQEIADYNDEQDHNLALATWQSIAGYGIEMLYSNEQTIPRYACVNPSEVAIVYDNSIEENIQFAIRYFEIANIKNENITRVEVYTDTEKTVYEKVEGKYKLIDEDCEFLEFGQVPFAVYPNNNDMVGDFEKIISLIDAYNLSESDTANDQEYFTDAYLMVTGATLESSDADELRKKRIINLPDSESKAEFLVKQNNDVAVENYKNRLNSDIHKFSFIPDITSEGFVSSISGEALKFKFSALNNICKTKHNKFKKGLMRRIELLCTFLGKLEGTAYTSIVPVFTLNMPKNNADVANLINQLEGKLPLETLISMLDGVEDARFELDKLREEGVESNDLNKVNSQAMSRKAFIVKHLGVTDAEADKMIEQMATEREILEESYSSTETDEVVEEDNNTDEVVEDEILDKN